MTTSFQLLKQTFRLIGENPSLFLKIILIPAILSIVLVLIQPSSDTAIFNLYEWALYLVLVIAAGVANIFMAVALVYAVADRNLSASRAFILAKEKFWVYITYSIVLALITAAAYLLLIIPGIIVTVWFVFGSFFLLLENTSIVGSLKASRSLVRGRWWSVAVRLLFIFFVAIIFTIVITSVDGLLISFLPDIAVYIFDTVFSTLLTPFAVAYTFLLYYNLKNLDNSHT